jgi:hypothetical protein
MPTRPSVFLSGIAAVFCLVFVLQGVFVQAADTGLLGDSAADCCHTHPSGETPLDHDCHAPCHHWISSAPASPLTAARPCYTEQNGFSIGDSFAPDGPVRAIDHPPQLS